MPEPSTRTGARRITAATVTNAKLPDGKAQHDIFDNVVPGFGLRLGKTKKTWFVMTRRLVSGTWKQVRVTLGDSNELDITQAREQARQAIAMAKQGKDPADVRKDRQQAMVTASRDTYATVRDDFLKRYVGRKKTRPAESSLKHMANLLNADVFASWSDRPITAITDRDIIEALDQLVARGAPVRANRALSYLKRLFRWSKGRRIVATDPTTDIERPGAEEPRERVLSLEELAAIWHAAADADTYGAIVRMLMLTGQRREEIGALRWSEIATDHHLDEHRTGAVIILPPSRCKNRRRHIIPLSAPALALIEPQRTRQAAIRQKTDFVFGTMGARSFGDWHNAKARLDAQLPDLAHWTIHDLRRSFVTHMADKLRIAPHIIEAVINHVSGAKAGVAGVYNRAEYLTERADALDAWADFVLRLVGDKPADNVVALREAG